MKKKKAVKQNKFIYSIFKLLTKLISKYKFNLEILRNEVKDVKDSFILLSNHESAIDFIPAASCIPRSSFVISASFYNTIPLQIFMDSIKVIPKQQFQTSPSDLKKMKEIVDNNIPLVIYPAGLMSEQGSSTPIPESTGKFLKWLNKDVYVSKIRGGYLTKPKWSKKYRKGKITLDLYKLLSKEELHNITNEELFDLLNKELFFDAYEDQEKYMIPFSNGDNIEGLEGVLYKCPKCYKEFSMKVENKTKLLCLNCGNSAYADKYGLLNNKSSQDVIFKRPSDWAIKIENELYDEILNNENFELSSKCNIYLINKKKHRYELKGNGNIVVNRKNIELSGMLFNKPFSKKIPSYIFPTLPFIPNERFEIQDGETSYRIVLENKMETTKFVWTIKNLYKINKHINFKN